MSNSNGTTRPRSTEITLAGTVYFLTKPLTLGQCRDIGIGCASVPLEDPAQEFGRLFNSAVTIIATALSKEHPHMTAAAILDSEVQPDEMWKAMDEVLQFAGLAKRAPASGEAQAVAAT